MQCYNLRLCCLVIGLDCRCTQQLPWGSFYLMHTFSDHVRDVYLQAQTRRREAPRTRSQVQSKKQKLDIASGMRSFLNDCHEVADLAGPLPPYRAKSNGALAICTVLDATGQHHHHLQGSTLQPRIGQHHGVSISKLLLPQKIINGVERNQKLHVSLSQSYVPDTSVDVIRFEPPPQLINS